MATSVAPLSQHSHLIVPRPELDTWTRGVACFLNRQVRGLQVKDDWAQATVLPAHDVELFAADGKVRWCCDCQEALDLEEPCAHTIATLLAALTEHAGWRQFRGEWCFHMFGIDDWEDDDELDEFDDELSAPPLRSGAAASGATAIRRVDLDSLLHVTNRVHAWRPVAPRYFLDPRHAVRSGRIQVHVGLVGARGQLSGGPVQDIPLTALGDEADRWALLLLRSERRGGGWMPGVVPPEPLAPRLLELLARTGRLHYVDDPGPLRDAQLHALDLAVSRHARETEGELQSLLELPVLEWDDGPPWRVQLEFVPAGPHFEVRAALARDGERRELSSGMQVTPGLLLLDGRLAQLDADGVSAWLATLRTHAALQIEGPRLREVVQRLLVASDSVELVLPERAGITRVEALPVPVLTIDAPGRSKRLGAKLMFDYAGSRIPPHAFAARHLTGSGRIVHRDRDAERAATDLVLAAGFEERRGMLALPSELLEAAIATLLEQGVEVLAENLVVRRPTSSRVTVTSGMDWFGLEGGASFGGVELPLPDLLAAVRAKQRFVRLGDGSMGLLPAQWLERWGAASMLARGDAAGPMRLGRVHLGLLDTLLDAATESSVDPAFAKLRSALRDFDGIPAVRKPRGFQGTLRSYQKEGLDWLAFHEQLGFGACLADDMGLGKTVQVIALLVHRRARRAEDGAKRRPPALVVVPRSLIHNWCTEFERFAPKLRVHVHHGGGRGKVAGLLDHDVVLTTYGTMARDIHDLATLTFDSIVLDEAQAIKNAASATAKAARKLNAPHRIAMSGTPIENHLGELRSLFEFLNPGLFDRAEWARGMFSGRAALDPRGKELVRAAVRPFTLRRTKAQVARDLPARTEQTLWVELDRNERREYEEVHRYLQAAIEAKGATADGELTPHVLAALLRLRQAACHPGLLDSDRAGESGSKVELLIEQLRQLTDEGHKALVFSQFTSLLAIVRDRLEAESIEFEYLDGATRDRAARVAHFQSDDGPSVFLISLKAGGVGLNLTAADYVFLLDPWWNPAAEAQAIDRTHRIGQSRPVVAYRLICRGTVEERVAELQDKKRQLVAAVLGDGSELAEKLTRRDLEALLQA